MKTKDCCSQFYLLRKCIFSLLFLVAGVLLFQSVQAQIIVNPPPAVQAGMGDIDVPVPPGIYEVSGATVNAATLWAHNGGSIKGTPGSSVTLNLVQGTGEVRMLRAQDPGSLIDMTGVHLEINIPGGVINAINRGALADTGGTIILTDAIVSVGSTPFPIGRSRALEAGEPGSTLTATNTTILIGARTFGAAFSFSGAKLFLSDSTVTCDSGPNSTPVFGVRGSNSIGLNCFAFGNDGVLRVTTLTATDTTITFAGNDNYFVRALGAGATTTLNHCTVTGSGTNNFGLVAEFLGGEVDVLNHSTVTSMGSSDGALVDSQSVLNVSDSTIHGDRNGIVVSDVSEHTSVPDRITLTRSSLTTLAGGNGEAAFRVEGAQVNILLDSSTVDSGTGAGVTQRLFLNVTPIDLDGGEFPSLVKLTATNSSTLNGDILVDPKSMANVFLERGSTLNGAVNENQLTGATGINPNPGTPQVNPLVFPGPLPLSVNLGIDSTSTWNMRASSTVNTLTVNAQAHINFADPPAAPFKTLLVNNLIGTGGIFNMNNDLAAIKGDLIEILTKSEGQHLLTFNNRTVGSDLPVNTALLVVRTPDGGAAFRGEEDGGTFRYFVVHGDGSSVTPVRNDWYLVRGDAITPPETTPPPPTNPNPTPTPPPTGGPAPAPPAFTPGDALPLPPEPPPRRLSLLDDLTPAANASIGTFSATMPLFYADMDTLIERMGELRLQTQEAPAPTTTVPSGTSKEGGKEVVASPPPVTPPAGGGLWVRGFGSGSHINDQVSGSFDQNLGGFQVGADKRLVTRYGDLYLGAFAGYFYAHRDFQEPSPFSDATGTTSAFSVGAYSTLINPSGFYADLVVKYTQLWNDFNAPNLLSSLGLGSPGTSNYSIPTFGASLEIGKRWDFGHFFLEPQGQIEGAWAGGTDYTVSTGLRVNADSQTSLRGRLGIRAGYHVDCGSMAFEPYAKVSVINEFLGGDRITTNQTSFFPTLSGVGIQAAAGVTARLTNSTYLYGEYDYANSDKVRIPFAIAAGIRLVW